MYRRPINLGKVLLIRDEAGRPRKPDLVAIDMVAGGLHVEDPGLTLNQILPRPAPAPTTKRSFAS